MLQSKVRTICFKTSFLRQYSPCFIFKETALHLKVITALHFLARNCMCFVFVFTYPFFLHFDFFFSYKLCGRSISLLPFFFIEVRSVLARSYQNLVHIGRILLVVKNQRVSDYRTKWSSLTSTVPLRNTRPAQRERTLIRTSKLLLCSSAILLYYLYIYMHSY